MLNGICFVFSALLTAIELAVVTVNLYKLYWGIHRELDEEQILMLFVVPALAAIATGLFSRYSYARFRETLRLLEEEPIERADEDSWK